MCHEIRKYMAIVDGDEPLGGPFKTVQVDEAYIGGVLRGKGRGYKGNKMVAIGMWQKGGEIITRIVPNRRKGSLLPQIAANVKLYSELHTDKHPAYADMGAVDGYWHKQVDHDAGEYVSKDNVTTNGIEGFWAQLKRSINGAHIHVSQRHLANYLDGFEFRHNRRKRPEAILSFAR
jgi:transposase-like protein